MEKYKLKKDTFFYKASTICRLTPKGNLVLDDNIGTCILYRKELKDHPELLDEWFEKIEEKKYGGRVREEGDACWYIDEEGDTIEDCWMPTELQLIIYKAGNIFWTKEEAERELARRKAYVILKEDTKGFKPDWKDSSKRKYIVCYDYELKRLAMATFLCSKVSELVFATEEDAQASIKAHKKEWKTWLGVEDE